ncbi:flagellar hook capping FlgD N-terminal domain-containing protein [Cognatiyoonia sp. IB215446]|uniref:flagellar hook capping FlgD N-terminal domain-containing protein n=1 Tax=Cognatiyoonia sp. IB215446 TaxID=3097355 RepID=UPI002A17E3EA|nr:flagellar hook capping FlgD N-terminal domain-containing protein [Cognatiyoonia sp. IB215446]MDX8346431.1 flagellar hook capping FlgD N-terminal domain-containing protein [Cognatiyoonia sp. IB215446]
MEVNQIANTANTGSNTNTSSSSAISSDFDTFLQMLTAQMQYQDPLNPIESTDFATQLATFSNVEQAVLTNDLLKELTAQMNFSGLADMAAWVGKEARAAAPAYFDGEPLTLAPNPPALAESAEIIVRNENGQVVQQFAVSPTPEAVSWAGVGPGGEPFSPGQYTFELVSRADDEILSEDLVEVYSDVTEVRMTEGQTVLILKGGAAVPSSQVTALRDPA